MATRPSQVGDSDRRYVEGSKVNIVTVAGVELPVAEQIE